MHYLIIYDLPDTETRARKKISDICLDFGMIRVQYSAFWGELIPSEQRDLLIQCNDALWDISGDLRCIAVCDQCLSKSYGITRNAVFDSGGMQPLVDVPEFFNTSHTYMGWPKEGVSGEQFSEADIEAEINLEIEAMLKKIMEQEEKNNTQENDPKINEAEGGKDLIELEKENDESSAQKSKISGKTETSDDLYELDSIISPKKYPSEINQSEDLDLKQDLTISESAESIIDNPNSPPLSKRIKDKSQIDDIHGKKSEKNSELHELDNILTPELQVTDDENIGGKSVHFSSFTAEKAKKKRGKNVSDSHLLNDFDVEEKRAIAGEAFIRELLQKYPDEELMLKIESKLHEKRQMKREQYQLKQRKKKREEREDPDILFI